MKSPISALLAGVLLIAVVFATAHAQSDLSGVMKASVGVNGVWFDGPDNHVPRDIEIGGTAAASLSPHISAVGALYYGFDKSYIRWVVGPRITATDVNDPNFSVGLGLSYRGASEATLRPNEWGPDATVGWKPWPAANNGMPPSRMSKVTLGGQGWYGLDSKRIGALLAVRYNVWKQSRGGGM